MAVEGEEVEEEVVGVDSLQYLAYMHASLLFVTSIIVIVLSYSQTFRLFSGLINSPSDLATVHATLRYIFGGQEVKENYEGWLP